jgi:hypothetical protein
MRLHKQMKVLKVNCDIEITLFAITLDTFASDHRWFLPFP